MWYGKWRFSNCTRMIKTRKLKHAYNNFLILLVYFQKEVTLDTLRWFWITMDDKSFLCCCFFCFRYAKHPDNLEKWLNFKENLISKGYTGLMHRSKKKKHSSNLQNSYDTWHIFYKHQYCWWNAKIIYLYDWKWK